MPWESTDRNVDIYNGLGSVWRHLAKDWSAEGQGGMRDLQARLTSMISEELRSAAGRHRRRGADPAAVLLPGCGTGRLAWEVACALPEASVIGTEVSEAQLGVARHMLACTEPGSLTVHPWLDESGNNATELSRLAGLKVPDVAPNPNPHPKPSPNPHPHPRPNAHPHSHPNPIPNPHPKPNPNPNPHPHPHQVPDVAPGTAPPNLSLQLVQPGAARLVPTSEGRQQMDVVCTCFFLDCLPDTLAGVRAVRDALRPGGP